MKKLLSIAVCASAVAAFGEAVDVSLAEVGVTAITSSLTNTIVAVSYEDLGGGDITASNVVKTANLSVGDRLYIFNNGKYQVYQLDSDKKWIVSLDYELDGVGQQQVINSPVAALKTLGVGSGFWLVRPNGWAGDGTFYTYGKPFDAALSTNITHGTTAMVGNPRKVAATPTITNAAVGDTIHVPSASNANKIQIYTYNGTDFGYGSTRRGKTRTVLSNIPAGTGFWYVAKGTNSVSDVTITWAE